MNLPEKYQWLNAIAALPNTIKIGLSYLGTAEVIGKGSNKTIIDWRDILNQKGAKVEGFSDDDIPWCGLFAAWIAYNRINDPTEVVASPLWARAWANYGVKADKASLGDVLVFARNGGGHVGFYVGEDASCYHVLGGNQSDKVCITRIQKSRMIAARRPKYKTQPDSVRPYLLATSGAVSTNEA